MDREILFKGKRVDGNGHDGEWIYGYGTTGEQIIHLDIYAGFVGVKVDPSTVGQYAEKQDKNGEKIFDGDIICFKEWSNGPMCWVGAVEYDYGAMYVIRGGPNQECKSPFELQLSRIASESIEVIGNIHDNPELIGGDGDG